MEKREFDRLVFQFYQQQEGTEQYNKLSKSLAKYRIKNAIIMAAGQGMRMKPLTNKLPKPLIKVNEMPMIEYMITGMQKIGIENIYIVIGFMKEKFTYLKEKYSNISFIETNEYSFKNNIASLYAARHIIGQENCYITEADFVINNYSIFKKYIYNSQYMGQCTEVLSGWGFKMEGNRIKRIVKENPDIELVGITCWKREDALILAKAVERAYLLQGHEKLWWDEVVNTEIENIYMTVQQIGLDEVIELDTIEELQKIDSAYR